MQHKYFVSMLLILFLLLPGAVRASAQNQNISKQGQLKIVLLNGVTKRAIAFEATGPNPGAAPTATDDTVEQANEPIEPTGQENNSVSPLQSDPSSANDPFAEPEDPTNDPPEGTLPDLQVPVEQVTFQQIFLPLISSDRHTSTSSAAVSQMDAMAASDFGTFDKNRIPVELQAWWTPAYGHAHVAAFVPLGQKVSGILNIPIRIVMHDNPGALHRFNFGDESILLTTVNLKDIHCAQSVCAWGLTVPIDTTKEADGWREWRIKAYVNTPDGKQMISSSGLHVLVNNNKARSDYRSDCNGTNLIGRGWYTSMGYTNGVIECTPTAPVHGQVTFRVKVQNPSKHLTVDLDKSHFIPAVGAWPAQADSMGINLFNKDGNFNSWVPITIDTTKLTNGWHGLAVKSTGANGTTSQCSGCSSGLNFPEGVAKVWFYVAN